MINILEKTIGGITNAKDLKKVLLKTITTDTS